MNYLRYFFILSFLFSCSSNQQEEEFHLPEDKMVGVLIDFHIAETFVAFFPGSNDSLNTLTQDYYQSIFEKHEISKTDFSESMKYYSTHPTEFTIVLARVVDSLSLQLATIESGSTN